MDSDTSIFLSWLLRSVEDKCTVHLCWISLWYHTSYLVNFLTHMSSTVANPADYITRLKVIISKLKATPVHKILLKKTFIHNNLFLSTNVCIQHDVVQKPLQRFYNDPYKVLKLSNKHQYSKTWQARHLSRLLESILCGTPTNWAFSYHYTPTNPAIPPTPTNPSEPKPVPLPITNCACPCVHWHMCLISTVTLFTGRE